MTASSALDTTIDDCVVSAEWRVTLRAGRLACIAGASCCHRIAHIVRARSNGAAAAAHARTRCGARIAAAGGGGGLRGLPRGLGGVAGCCVAGGGALPSPRAAAADAADAARSLMTAAVMPGGRPRRLAPGELSGGSAFCASTAATAGGSVTGAGSAARLLRGGASCCALLRDGTGATGAAPRHRPPRWRNARALRGAHA